MKKSQETYWVTLYTDTGIPEHTFLGKSELQVLFLPSRALKDWLFGSTETLLLYEWEGLYFHNKEVFSLLLWKLKNTENIMKKIWHPRFFVFQVLMLQILST